MATQLKEPDPVIEEPEAGTEGAGDEQQAPRDFDAEARQHGWVPKDEFKGDPARWVDAETFATRADEVMPLLRKTNEHLKRELKDVRKQARRLTDHFNKAEERIRGELMEEMEAAVEAGDVAGFRKLKARSDDLAKGAAKPEHTQAEAMEAFDDFRDANPWYDRANLASASEIEVSARLYADRMTEKNLDKTADMAPPEFFAMIEGLVKEKYPTVGTKAPRTKPVSDVAGATSGRAPRQNGKGFNDLPPEAQRACDKWVKQGLIKDRAAYLASYDWS